MSRLYDNTLMRSKVGGNLFLAHHLILYCFRFAIFNVNWMIVPADIWFKVQLRVLTQGCLYKSWSFGTRSIFQMAFHLNLTVQLVIIVDNQKFTVLFCHKVHLTVKVWTEKVETYQRVSWGLCYWHTLQSHAASPADSQTWAGSWCHRLRSARVLTCNSSAW